MKDDGQPLARRVPGEIRSALGPSRRPVLSPAELRRMQAAVDAAKAEAAALDDEPTGPLPRINGSSPPSNASGITVDPGAAGTDRVAVTKGRTKLRHSGSSSVVRHTRRGVTPVNDASRPTAVSGNTTELR